MSSIEAAHEDVAAYALNLMEPDEAWRFERHLLACEQCTTALTELAPVADTLAQVDAKHLLVASQSFNDGRVLRGMLDTASKQRSRGRALRLVSIAAGIVALVIVSVLGVAVGMGPLKARIGGDPGPGGSNVAEGPQTADVPGRSASASANSRQNAAPGSPCEPGKESKFTKTDPATGVKATVVVTCESWGTPITMTLSNIVGPMQCDIIVKTRQGREISEMKWRMPAGGYGTTEQPRPLALQTVSEVLQSEIGEVLMRGTAPGGTEKQMISVPLR